VKGKTKACPKKPLSVGEMGGVGEKKEKASQAEEEKATCSINQKNKGRRKKKIKRTRNTSEREGAWCERSP